jgi:AraC-like DNA-binding protein
VSREQLLRAGELELSQLKAPNARLPRSTVYRLSALALELTGDPALGLHWAETVNEGSFVPLSHVMAHSATLRQAFESLASLHRLLSDQPSFQLVERNDKASVRIELCGEALAVQRFSAEMAVSGFYHMLRRAGPRALPESVSFEYPAPAYEREYARVFQGAVLFQQPFTGVLFDRALLDAPALDKDDDVHEALKALAERRLQGLTRSTPYHVQVREFLVRERRGQRVDMDEVARALHLSVRSLRRRLAAEGKAYGEIADEALAVVAKHLLRDKRRSIQETAYELGFGSFSAFHRAFRRSTGTTPCAYRDAQTDDAKH